MSGRRRLAFNSNLEKSTGSWCLSSSEERAFWGGLIERGRESGFARSAIRDGFASEENLGRIAKAWRAVVEDEDGWLGLLHGQILCWK